jgi:hypothetical protein
MRGIRVRSTIAGRIGVPAVFVVSLMSASGCDVNRALERVAEARRLADDLQVEFTKASDAANRAVMADTDEASETFAREAAAATSAVQHDADALAPVLAGLRFSEEVDRLEDFRARFADYLALDRSILELAVENTNLKAQRLSFGPAHDAVDALRDALSGVEPSAPAETWHVRALAETAVASARDIEASEAPHIAEAGEPAMADIETRMNASETAVRDALRRLNGLVLPASKQHLAAATRAFDTFMDVNRQIIALSRRNTNVRSMALSLNQKRTVVDQCESSLRALRDSLAKRGFTGIR